MAIEIKEHGIYERRDGKIVGPAVRSGGIDFPWTVGDRSYTPVGGYIGHSPGTAIDLISEIVVGENWIPHNGGENPAPGKVVEVMVRCGPPARPARKSEAWEWAWSGMSDEILAYRIIEEAETGKEDFAASLNRASMERFERQAAAPIKLRADLPERFGISRAGNGGLLVAADGFTLAAFTRDADLLAWLTEDVKPS